MQKVIIDKNKCESYKTFYEIIYTELEGKLIPDWEEYDNLHYNADLLDEFLWYAYDDIGFEFVMINFDSDRLTNLKTYDDYEWKLIFEVLRSFTEKYPKNKLTIVNE